MIAIMGAGVGQRVSEPLVAGRAPVTTLVWCSRMVTELTAGIGANHR